jgi:peptide-methionine (S)-S-oxide reductase
VLRTRVGYAGGKQDKPTYRRIGDHTEAIQIEFDPNKITFEKLLEIFWAEHDPHGPQWSTQYKAVLWTHDEAQARTAKAEVARIAKQAGKPVTTAVTPATTFWIAEDYHQKYRLRSRGALLKALLGEKADGATIRDSTLAARVNGWLAGHGTPEEIVAEAKRLGLDEKARADLAKALGKRVPALCK